MTVGLMVEPIIILLKVKESEKVLPDHQSINFMTNIRSGGNVCTCICTCTNTATDWRFNCRATSYRCIYRPHIDVYIGAFSFLHHVFIDY